mmetsp:Transcript_129421/g.307066  ORF Transcript_129421/g.307066 Transcript_129421/m.307066 type:complete len:243 (+) Transcript_129421:860-1588(+)
MDIVVIASIVVIAQHAPPLHAVQARALVHVLENIRENDLPRRICFVRLGIAGAGATDSTRIEVVADVEHELRLQVSSDFSHLVRHVGLSMSVNGIDDRRPVLKCERWSGATNDATPVTYNEVALLLCSVEACRRPLLAVVVQSILWHHRPRDVAGIRTLKGTAAEVQGSGVRAVGVIQFEKSIGLFASDAPNSAAALFGFADAHAFRALPSLRGLIAGRLHWSGLIACARIVTSTETEGKGK